MINMKVHVRSVQWSVCLPKNTVKYSSGQGTVPDSAQEHTTQYASGMVAQVADSTPSRGAAA